MLKRVPARLAMGLSGSHLGGLALSLVGWELIGRLGLLGKTWPPLTAVLAYAVEPAHARVLLRALEATVTSALCGFVIGSCAGLALACSGVLWPALQRGLDQLAAVVNAVPLIALGPVLIVTVGRESTPVAIAALAVFFGVFVAAASGLKHILREQRDLLAVLGAGRARALWLVQLPAAAPAIMDGLRLSASAAVVGAILGEWFGSERGLGLVLVSAMQNFQILQLWSAALLGVLMSLLAFGGLGLLQQRVEARYR